MLLTATESGHCGLSISNLLEEGQKLLEINVAVLQEALALELSNGTVIKDMVKNTESIFLAGLYTAEKGISERHTP